MIPSIIRTAAAGSDLEDATRFGASRRKNPTNKSTAKFIVTSSQEQEEGLIMARSI
jgi:hypothetical protein